MQMTAVQQGPPDFKRARVKGDGGYLSDSEAAVETQIIGIVHQCDYILMAYHDPFGASRGTGRINNVSQACRRSCNVITYAGRPRRLRPGGRTRVQFEQRQVSADFA